MFDNNAQNVINNGEAKAGVFNQFVAPITSDNLRNKKDIVRVVLLIILLVSLLSAGVAFFYAKTLTQEITNKKQDLQAYASTTNVLGFEENLPKMRNTSQRLKLLNDVYNSRQYISGMFFPVLSSLVESTRISYVYFSRVSLKRDTNNNLTSVSLSGVALDYPTLYRQVNNFKFGPYADYIYNFKLQNFTLNQDMHVEFSLDFDIGINTPNYLKFLNLESNPNSSSTVNSGPLLGSSTSQVNSGVSQASTSTETGSVDFETSTTTNNSKNTSLKFPNIVN